jgi:sigma-B regulation protein RsbU (phosphoserine phosphatase)
VFYGILNPITGMLTYCNAGHNPPYLLNTQNSNTVQALRGTGLPLGIFEDVTWTRASVQLVPGDTLVLYTDGIPEARDQQEIFFGDERLLKTIQANLGRSAQDIQDALIAEVHTFVGDTPRLDDITVMVVVQDS